MAGPTDGFVIDERTLPGFHCRGLDIELVMVTRRTPHRRGENDRGDQLLCWGYLKGGGPGVQIPPMWGDLASKGEVEYQIKVAQKLHAWMCAKQEWPR